MGFSVEDRTFMEQALRAAAAAGRGGEVPIGAVLVHDGKILARGQNRPIRTSDPTAHAEIVALRRAARKLGNYRLDHTTLYATVEPCLMCTGAMLHARVDRVVYACADPKIGALAHGAVHNLPGLNHRLEVESGLEAERSAALLKSFFRQRRATSAKPVSSRRGTEVVVTGPTRNRIGG